MLLRPAIHGGAAAPTAFANTPAASPADAAAPVLARGFAKFSKDGKFAAYDFTRHAVGDNDIKIDILYAGICHSDIHHALEDWKKEEYRWSPATKSWVA